MTLINKIGGGAVNGGVALGDFPPEDYILLAEDFHNGISPRLWVPYGQRWQHMVCDSLLGLRGLRIERPGSLTHAGGCHVRSRLPWFPVLMNLSQAQNIHVNAFSFSKIVLEFMLYTDYYMKQNAFFGFADENNLWPQGDNFNICGLKQLNNPPLGEPSFFFVTSDGANFETTHIGNLADPPADCQYWHKYRIECYFTDFMGNDGRAECYLDDVLVATHETYLYSAMSYYNNYFRFGNVSTGSTVGLTNIRIWLQ